MLLIRWLFVFVLMACQEQSFVSTPADKTLRLALEAKVQSVDPAKAYDTVSTKIVTNVYESLFQYHYLKRPYTLEPLLAEEMPVIKNKGKKFIIKIKKGVLYHPNPALPKDRTVKAQDFIDQIKRLVFAPTNSPAWYLIEENIKGVHDFRYKVSNQLNKIFETSISGIKLIDDHTFSIELIQPNTHFLNVLALQFFAPIPKEAIIYFNNQLTGVSVGTGPYLIQSFNQAKINLEKNPQYRKSTYPKRGDRVANENLLKDSGKSIPFIEKISLQVINDNQSKLLKFLRGELDLLLLEQDLNDYVFQNRELSPQLQKIESRHVQSPTLTLWWLAFNLKNPIFKKEIRLAFAHAINREDYIKKFTKNRDQIANSIYPPGLFAYNPSSTQPFKYDLAKARELLKSAGYPGGKGFPTIKFHLRNTSPNTVAFGEFIKNSLAKIGIQVEVENHKFQEFLMISRRGQLDFWQEGWTFDYPDAENILQLLLSKNHSPGLNTSFFSNSRIDVIYQQIKSLPDNDQRRTLLAEAQEIINTEFPWILFSYERQSVLVQKRLLNFRSSDIVTNYFKYLRIK